MLLYVHQTIDFATCDQVAFSEALLCEIDLANKDKLLLASLYRSPSSTEENFINLCQLLKDMCKKQYSHLLFFGDFNIPEIDWITNTVQGSENSLGFKFLETIRDCYLYQHVTETTRGRGTNKPSTIDLIFTNEQGMVRDLSIDAPLGKSDHSLVNFSLVLTTKRSNTCTDKFNFEKGNYLEMGKLLQDIDWDSEFSGITCDVNQQWELFRDKLNTAVQLFVPKKPYRPISERKANKMNVSPMDKDTLSMIKKKQRLWTRYLKERDKQTYIDYCKIRNRVRSLTRKQVKNHERGIALQAKSNPKLFWKYVRSKTKTRERIPDLYANQKKERTSSDLEKAEVLSDYFASVFTVEPKDNFPIISVKDVPALEMPIVTPEKVRKKLDSLNTSKSPGPDQISPRILKELSGCLSKPLSLIFNASLSNQYVPNEWKEANITAIYKKGDQKDPGNYRPVSLTCIICKILESFIRDSIMEHMRKHKLFSDKQFGFINGRSTVLQLLKALDEWTLELDMRKDVNVIYCDFMKAFDKVPHLRLIHKLKMYGITEPYTSWFKSFLLDRRQRVVVNGTTSEWKEVTSGVPQGSVLGPLLFVLYINDLPDVIKNGSGIYLFADDTKLYKSISSTTDCESLQKDLFEMQKWADMWLLKFHPDKCKVMKLGNKNQTVFQYALTESSTPMNYVTSEKDIGVTIDNKLTFDVHIAEKVSKANSMMGLIRRSMEYMDKDTFRLLYTALVRPHLEFANAIWSPYLIKHINMIENVQRRATKMVPGLSDLSYSDRLKRLNLPTLSYRRKRGDMIEMYKILSGKYDTEVTTNLIPLRRPGSTRGHERKIFKTHSRLNIRKYSFVQRSANSWNSLPPAVIEAKSLREFEKHLDAHWANQPIRYHHDKELI